MKKPEELQYPSVRRRAVAIFAGGYVDLAVLIVPAMLVGGAFGAISPVVGQIFSIITVLASVGVLIAMAHKGFSPGKWLFGYQIIDRDSAEPVGAIRYYVRSVVAAFSAALYTSISLAPALFVKAMGEATNQGNYRDPRTIAHVIEDQHHRHQTDAAATATGAATAVGMMAFIQKYGFFHDKIFKTCAVKIDRKEVLNTLFKPRTPVADMTHTQAQPPHKKAA